MSQSSEDLSSYEKNSHFSFEDSDKDDVRLDEDDITPWMGRDTRIIKNPQIRFHNEIIDFFYFIKPSKKEHNKRAQIVKNILQKLESQIPGCKAYPHGSFVMELYLPSSDVDLVLIDEKRETKTLMNMAKKYLQSDSQFKDVEVIKSAKVPLIKFSDRES